MRSCHRTGLSGSFFRIHDAATECDDSQIVVLMNCVENKKQKYYECRFTLLFLKIASPGLSTWQAVHSCNCERQLTVTSQRKFISAFNFEAVLLFGLFTRHKTMC